MDLKIASAIILISCLYAAKTSHAESYNFGVVPQQSASKMAKLWVPILNYVSQHSGHKLQFKTAKNIPAFEKQLASASYDIAYMNPYHYTVFHTSANYIAIAKASDKRIKGILVTKKDSPYEELKEFSNQTLAFPAPEAFGASILTQSEFNQQGISISADYVSSHDSVYRNVAQGRYPAGGGVMRTLQNTEPEINQQLKVIWTSKGYTPHAIAVHQRLPEEHVHAIQKALVEIKNTQQGQVLLKKLNLKGLMKAKNSDWDDVRKLKHEH